MSTIHPSPDDDRHGATTLTTDSAASTSDVPPGQTAPSNSSLPAQRAQRHETLLVVVPGVVLATLLTAWHYSSKPLWRDEWFTYSTVERPFTGMVRLLADKDGGLAGFYLAMHAWMLLGDSVAWMRLPAALCTVLVAALTALLGRRVGGTAAGLVSGLLVAVLPAVVGHAQEARAYPLVLAAVTATGLAALRYQDRPSSSRWWALAALGLTAATLHPLPGVPAVAGIFLGLLLLPGAASRWRVLLAGVPAALVAVGLIALGAIQNDVTSVGNVGGVRQIIGVRQLLTPSWVLLLAMVALSVLSLVRLMRIKEATATLLGWITLPLLSLTALIALGSFFQARYAATILPAVTVLIAVGVVAVADLTVLAVQPRRRVAAQWVVAAAVAASMLAPLTLLAGRYITSSFQTDDPRAATNSLVAGYRDGDAVIYSGTMARGLTEFYAPTDAHLEDPLLVRSPIASNTVSGNELPAANAPAALRGHDRLWVIGTMSGPSTRWNDQDKVDIATAGRALVESRTFGRYRLQLWIADDPRADLYSTESSRRLYLD